MFMLASEHSNNVTSGIKLEPEEIKIYTIPVLNVHCRCY